MTSEQLDIYIRRTQSVERERNSHLFHHLSNISKLLTSSFNQQTRTFEFTESDLDAACPGFRDWHDGYPTVEPIQEARP